MNPFALDSLEEKNQIANAVLNPGDMRDDVGVFSGVGRGFVKGFESAYYKRQYVDNSYGTNPEDKKSASKYLKDYQRVQPDPSEIGVAGRALFGFSDMITSGIFSFVSGNVTPQMAAMDVGLTQQKASEADLIAQGIDPKTARDMSTTEGAYAGLGMVAPISMSGNVATRALSGAALSWAIGASDRALMSKTLMDNGYKDMAAQYKAFDAAASLTDILIGGFMGGAFGGRVQPRAKIKAENIKPSDIDASLTMNNGAHIQSSAPGIPTDEATLNAHVAATEKALKDLMFGDSVDVSKEFTSDKMIVDPAKTEHAKSVSSIVAQHINLDEIQTNYASSIERKPAEVPGAKLGAETAVKVGREYLPAQWAVVDAGDVEATMQKADNQFRDRTRASSQAQIAEIANAPDYNLLSGSAIMDFGAPTLTRQGLIVGGNGRFAGVSKAYDQGTHAAYVKPLKADLEKYGIDPAAVDGMKKPVLVRIMQTDVDTKKAALASNEGAGLKVTELEQSKIDAERMGSMAGLQIDTEGNFNAGNNIDFIRNMVAQFPTNEKSGFIDSDGRLSAEGVRRVRNAILYKAYGDSPTLTRLVESTDPGARNVANALVRTASLVAEVKDAIASGNLYPLDISTDIASAVETFDRLRTDKTQVADYLNQSQMFANDLTIEARKILEFFDAFARSGKIMGEMITTYYEGVKAAGDPSQVDMLRAEPPTKTELLDGAIAKAGKDYQPQLSELPFDQPAANDIGAKLQYRVDNDFENLVKEYANLKASKGGQVLNTDIARELSPEYLADRTRSADVHEAASSFVKKLYAQRLAEATPEGKYSIVMFTAGGTGAGKSTGLEVMAKAAKEAEMIYDTNMNTLESAVKKIDQALEAGRSVSILYTFRDPVEALVNGALPRAMREERQFGTGRTVPLPEHLKTHIGSRTVVAQIQAKYAGDNRVSIVALDNSRGKGNHQVVPLENLPEIVDNAQIGERLNEALKQEYKQGNISESVFQGFSAERGAPGLDAASGERAGSQLNGADQQARNGSDGSIKSRSNWREAYDSSADSYGIKNDIILRAIAEISKSDKELNDILDRVQSDVVGNKSNIAWDVSRNKAASEATQKRAMAIYENQFSAQAIAADFPNLSISDGNGGLVNAREALAQADANITTAERESKAFEVAAQCALFGD